jgi:hypothetical protein
VPLARRTNVATDDDERGEGMIEAGNFETMTAAARRIRELEDYPVSGVFLQILAETDCGTDEESFGHLEHTGRRAL